MIGISSIVQSRGGVSNTSRKTGPNAVRSSSFEVCVVVVAIYEEDLGAPGVDSNSNGTVKR